MLPDELAPHAIETPQVFYEEGPRAGQVAEHSTKVGWTLRNEKGDITAAFAFLINPQGLTRTDGSRAQMFATKSGFYVDDFGPAPTTIQLRQIVASGKRAADGSFYTAREDVQRFLTRIYLPAMGAGTRQRVYFHDHHFQRGLEQRVYFPPNSFTTSRSVDQNGLWAIELQMIGLEKYPYAEIEATKAPPRTRASRSYTVRAGDTIDSLVRKLAGKSAGTARRKAVRTKLLELNPQIKSKRAAPDGTIAKPMTLAVGEILRLPA
jgi:hypothetical protein